MTRPEGRGPEFCPHCDVDLDASDTEVRCWRCGWEVRVVDDPIEFYRRADAIGGGP